MMLAWILSPIGRWLSLVGAVFAALGLPGSRAGPPARPHGKQDVKLQRPKPSPHPRRFDMMFKPIAMLLLIAVSTAGCATERLARNDCDWAQPIRPSRKDVLTRQTKEQIAAHNEREPGYVAGVR